jgi:hypothetical protein
VRPNAKVMLRRAWKLVSPADIEHTESVTEEHVVRRETHEVDILDVAHFRKPRRKYVTKEASSD